jgi:predicted nucleic acid-binding protein
MMKRNVTGLIASVAFLAVSHATTVGAQSPPPTRTYLSLLSQGFEVKSIILISTDEATHAAQSFQAAIEEGRVVIVTLQKEAVTARCWVAFTTYATNTPRNRQGELLPMDCY